MGTKEMPSLKALQALGEEMQQKIGFEPPINFDTTDAEELIKDIKINAADLDAEKDADAISPANKKTLALLGLGPWLKPEPKEEPAEESQKERPATSKKDKGKEEKKVSPKAAAKEPKKEVKKVAKKSGNSHPGIITTILDIIIKQGPITKEQIHKQLVKAFPDRNPESMKNTINVQIPGRIQKEKGIKLVEVEGKGWKKAK